MTCDEVRESLLDFVEGGLSGPPRAALEEHLTSCGSCAAQARETRRLVGDLGAAESIDRRALKGGASAVTQASPASAALRFEKLSLLGDYEIIDELGRGGMGVVYRARQVTLNRIVALKVLSVGVADSDRAVERFLKEAQAAARLHHTNIVPIYGQGHERGHFYYAMELVEGESLDKLLRAQGELIRQLSTANRSRSWVTSAIHTLTHRTHAGGGAHDFKRMARQIAEVAEALQHAHDQGVIHRDIKPQNLLLGRDNKLHITDFGLARILDEPGLTRSAEMVGTPAYMAPEQIHDGRHVDSRADIYALGVTLYEMLTLQRPFQAETYQQMIHQVLKREPRAPRKIDPHVPIDLETICLRAMEKSPAARFGTAADMARELRRYGDDYPIVSRPVGPIGKAARWVKRNPARTSALAACALALALGSISWIVLKAYANQRISAAERMLLDDYDDPDPALAELGVLTEWFGDAARATTIRAFANIKRDTGLAITSLEEHLEEYPDDADAHYLLAWARGRQPGSLESAVRATLSHGDRANERMPASAAGLFFKGQALVTIDADAAIRLFDESIARGGGAQARLHLGRAANNALLVQQNPEHWGMARSRLESACDLRRDKAYPRYLLSLGYRLWAVYNQDLGNAEGASGAFEKALALAREAQDREPDDPRGYIAEAEYREEIGEWEEALRLRESLGQCSRPKLKNIAYANERWAYAMRLLFWLGRYPEAQAAVLQVPLDPSSADGPFYLALLARSDGKAAEAQKILERGIGSVGLSAEERLKLDAGFRLIGHTPPIDLWDSSLNYETRLTRRWTSDWLCRVLDYYHDRISYETLIQDIRLLFPDHPGDQRRVRSGAEFYRGIKALCAGRRDEARDALRQAWKHHDMEDYCFRAKFLLIRLERDPDWPPWLPSAEQPVSR